MQNEIPEKWRAASLSKLNAGTEDEVILVFAKPWLLELMRMLDGRHAGLLLPEC
jgi:hypothetical protein